VKVWNSIAGVAVSRRGSCQRCGWFEPLVRIDRHEQAWLGVGHAYRWLCEDCVDDRILVTSGGRERRSEMAEACRSHHPSRLVVSRHFRWGGGAGPLVFE
jgi:hypothetical protein